jgi:signal transduction histidine kinase
MTRFARLGLQLGMTALCVAVFWLPLDDRSGWSLTVHLMLIAVLTTGMLLRSWVPSAAFALVGTATFVGAALHLTQDPFIAAAWTLYPVAIQKSTGRFPSMASALFATVLAAVAMVGSPEGQDAARYVTLSLVALAGAWALGTATGRRLLEVERRVSAEKDRAVAAERLRVAREVHDVVSHSLGTISVAAGVAARVDADDAARLRGKLQRIEQTSREALDELRIALGAIREGGEAAEREPLPGLGQLAGLVDRVRSTGTEVTLSVIGVDDVPPAIGLAVYRITQECLTNTARHAPGSRCHVVVTGSDCGVRVEIDDDGAGARSAESRPAQAGARSSKGRPVQAGVLSAEGRSGEAGYGLVGLRERVELLGGTFTAGHRPDGGFRVRATLPAGKQSAGRQEVTDG